jgi:predicted Zn-dependent peptidase
LENSGIYTSVLPNGLTLVAERIPGVRSASFLILLPAGAVTDPVGQEGAATVLEGMVYRGAGERDTRGVSDALDGLGVQRMGGVDLEAATFGGALLGDDLSHALAIYADVLRRPRLPGDQLEAERELALSKLARLNDDPTEKLFVELRRSFFPGAHGRSPLGTEPGLRALTPVSLREDHTRRYRPHGAMLAVAGSFDWEELQATVYRLFQDWEGAPPAHPRPSLEGRPAYVHVAQETAQEQIGLAYPAPFLGEPGYYEARMAVEVLSGGMGARLFTEVREKLGLAYSVHASLGGAKGQGYVIGYAGTKPERSQQTLDVMVREIKRLAEGVTEEELSRARIGLLSALIMQGEATRSRAGAIARDMWFLGRVRPLDEIRAGVEGVTPTAIVDHLRNFPARDFTIVTLGPTALEVPS